MILGYGSVLAVGEMFVKDLKELTRKKRRSYLHYPVCWSLAMLLSNNVTPQCNNQDDCYAREFIFPVCECSIYDWRWTCLLREIYAVEI